jgi:DNA-binding SARP family transcriptional activator
LLALCILNPRPITRATACAHLWPDLGEEESRANLRRHLSELTAALAPYGNLIETDRQMISWNAKARATVDVLQFEALAASKATSAEALALYRGDLLPSIYEDWLFAPRERLRATAVQLAHSLSDAAMRERDFARALEFAERALDLSEWREDSLRLAMTAHYALGNRTGALAAYDRFSDLLEREMHVLPMAETTALRDAILAGTPLPETQTPLSSQLDAAEDTPFVGRADDLRSLQVAWDRASRHAGNTVFVGGEAGIGKTRLMRELARYVDERGGSVLWGNASPDAITTYQPIVDAISSGIGLLGADDLDPVWRGVIASAIPELSPLESDAPVATLEGMRGAERLREGFARAIDAIARKTPVLLVIEDVHWSDVDTIDAIGHLARRLRGTAALLAVTHRSESVPLDHPLRTLRRSLLAENRAFMRSLGPLHGDDIAQLAPTEEIGGAVAAICGGNPLFAQQMIAHFAEQGTLAPGQFKLHALVGSRIDRLAPEVRAVLSLGALIDLHFTVEELAEVSGQGESEVLAAIDSLIDARFVRWSAAPGFRLTFAHQLLRNVALQTTPTQGRAAIHRRIGVVLDRTRTGDVQSAAIVARHCELGGLLPRAYELYIARARGAFSISALRSAVDLAHDAVRVAQNEQERWEALRVAISAHDAIASMTPEFEGDLRVYLNCASGLGENERFEALVAQIHFYRRNIEGESIQPLVDELLEQAHSSGRADWLRIAYEENGVWQDFCGNVTASIDSFTKSLEHAGPESFDGLRVRLLRVGLYLRSGQVEKGRAEFEAIDRVAPEHEALEARLSMAFSTLAIVLEDPDVIEAAGNRLIAHAERTGALGLRGVGMGLLMQAAYLTGHLTRGREMARDLLDFVEKHNVNMNRNAVRVNTGYCERYVGNVDSAIEIWKETLIIATRDGRADAASTTQVNLAEALLVREDYAGALNYAISVHDLATKTGEGRIITESALILGAAEALTAPDPQPGLARMRGAIEARRSIGSPKALANELSLLIETHARTGHLDFVRSYAEELRTIYASVRERLFSPARICMALAQAAEFDGDDAAVKRYVFEGVTLLKAMLERIPDEETRASQAALPFHRELLLRDPANR